MRLINVELKRFWSRKLVWGTIIGLLVIMALFLLNSYTISIPTRVAQLDPDWLKDRGHEPLFTFREQRRENLLLYALTIFAAAVLMGASFISTDIRTGTLGNWLTFEPRRTRVFFSKAVALALGILPIAAVALLLWLGGSLGVYAINSAVGGLDSELWTDLLWTMLRILAVTVFAALVGFTLAVLTKSTAATLVVFFGYLFVVEPAIGSFYPALQDWSLHANILAFLDYDVFGVHFSDSAIFFGVLITVLVVAAWLVFRRRDVN